MTTIGRTAELVGVSVRTLHHWDAIGLVRPSERTWADYRVYSSADVARIHRVLVYRELGFSLAEIARILDDPEADESTHLARQRELLVARISHLQEMVSAVDRMVEEKAMGTDPTPERRAEIFGSDWNPEYQREAEERWGDTPQWASSQERAARMTPEDWAAIKAESEELEAELGRAVREGLDPASDDAAALCARHRASIGHFYECTRQMQVLLARMYTGDPRFTEHYEAVQPGLTRWLRAAVEADARAHGIDPDTARWE